MYAIAGDRNMVQDGVEAKYVITDGLVKVNGEVEIIRK